MHLISPRRKRLGFIGWCTTRRLVPAGLAEGAAGEDWPSGTLKGRNNWQRSGSGGPYPPVGRHRNFYKLGAPDTVLPDLDPPTQAQSESALQGRVSAEVRLIGTYPY